MAHRIAADVVVALHLAFIVLVLLGGLLALRWRRAPWLHLPAAAWGALVAICGWTCPLTPLEVRLRRAAGEGGYAGGFIEHHILPIVYPEALTRELQVGLGVAVCIVNLVIYAFLCRRHGHDGSGPGRRERRHRGPARRGAPSAAAGRGGRPPGAARCSKRRYDAEAAADSGWRARKAARPSAMPFGFMY